MNKNNHKFVIETTFIKMAIKYNISLKEFIVLMYFDNEYENTFDVKKISKITSLSEKDVLTSFGTLLDKKIITMNPEKNEKGKIVDVVSLDNLYNIVKEDKNPLDDFYNNFQKIYGKSLSGMDYEIIKGWLDNGSSADLVLEATKEANYNGVASLRYIDKILYNWQKQGVKTKDDIHKKEEPKYAYDNDVMEFNWLDEDR